MTEYTKEFLRDFAVIAAVVALPSILIPVFIALVLNAFGN